MAKVLAQMKVFPSEVDVDLKRLQEELSNHLPKDASILKVQEEPIAFGLGALVVTISMAEKDGVIIGYVLCRIESGFSGMSLKTLGIAKKGHIISIAVLPENRNIGVGYALVDEALRAMSASYEAKSCYLEVRVSNDVALSLYKRTGFEVERTIREYYSDGEDAYIMSKKILSQRTASDST